MPCYFGPMMTVEELFSIPPNQGDTVNFYTCAKCFAAVQRQDRQQHAEWLEYLRRAIGER
jgi:hypothetical protein